MDNVFQELDYSDISAKHMTGDKNKKFSEIDTKRGGGILKLLISLILFILLIVFIIIVISKSVKVSSLKSDIKKYKKLIDDKNKELEDKKDYFKAINEDIVKKEKSLAQQKEEINKIINDKNTIEQENKDLIYEIENIEKQINDATISLDSYEDIEDNELIQELTKLEEDIEKLKQTPM